MKRGKRKSKKNVHGNGKRGKVQRKFKLKDEMQRVNFGVSQERGKI
jgi:hypothetical protein